MGREGIIIEYFNDNVFQKEEKIYQEWFQQKVSHLGKNPSLEILFEANVFYGYHQDRWYPLTRKATASHLTPSSSDSAEGILLNHGGLIWWYSALRVIAKSKPEPPKNLFQNSCSICNREGNHTYLKYMNIYVCSDLCLETYLTNAHQNLSETEDKSQQQDQLQIDYYDDDQYKCRDTFKMTNPTHFPCDELTQNDTYQFCYVTSDHGKTWTQVDLEKKYILFSDHNDQFHLRLETSQNSLHSFQKMKFIRTIYPDRYQNPWIINLIATCQEPDFCLNSEFNISVQDPPIETYQDLLSRITPFYFGAYRIYLKSCELLRPDEVNTTTPLRALGQWIRFRLEPLLAESWLQSELVDYVSKVYNAGYYQFQIERRNPYQEPISGGSDPYSVDERILALKSMIILLPEEDLQKIIEVLIENEGIANPLRRVIHDYTNF